MQIICCVMSTSLVGRLHCIHQHCSVLVSCSKEWSRHRENTTKQREKWDFIWILHVCQSLYNPHCHSVQFVAQTSAQNLYTCPMCMFCAQATCLLRDSRSNSSFDCFSWVFPLQSMLFSARWKFIFPTNLLHNSTKLWVIHKHVFIETLAQLHMDNVWDQKFIFKQLYRKSYSSS